MASYSDRHAQILNILEGWPPDCGHEVDDDRAAQVVPLLAAERAAEYGAFKVAVRDHLKAFTSDQLAAVIVRQLDVQGGHS